MFDISRNLSNAQLKVKLQAILNSLQKLSQYEHSQNDLNNLRSELIHLLDKKELQLLVCSIISEILRLYAPNNPYTAKETIKIFKCFLKQIKGDNLSSFYLVESISNVKSIVLLCDVDNDQLIIEYFNALIEMVNPQMSPNYQMLIRDILHQLGEEMQLIPTQIIELIITSFSKKVEKANPAKFKLICELSVLLDDKLQRYVCQHFTDQIIEQTRMEQNDLLSLHKLILQIFDNVPQLLLNVVPQLEEEMKVDNADTREIACNTLAEMYAKKGKNWIDSYPSVWKEWADRRNDKSLQIRLIFTNSFSAILINHPDTITIIEPMINSKLKDPDEKVRQNIISGCKAVIKEHCDLFSVDTLKEIALRCADKKSGPRKEALLMLAELFNLVMSYGGSVDMEKYSWIPGTLMEIRYLNDFETNFILEHCLQEYLLPISIETPERCNRLLQMLSNFDQKEYTAFIQFFLDQEQSQKYWRVFLDQCTLYNVINYN